MAKRSLKLNSHIAARSLYLVLRGGAVSVWRAVGLLAAGSQTSPDDDELNSSVRGGVLNYRTGKLDDGTDPYGWYEHD